MDAPRNAAIYCRLSFAPDGSVENVERQEADCRALAERLGWRVQAVYPDNSRSAWQKNRKRPAWDQMLKDIGAGTVDGIIVYHGDRLIRQPWDLELLLKLADDRHLPLAAPSGTRDLSNEDDRYILRIEAAGACRSSADTSRRVKRSVQARVAAGRSGGGSNRPFGFGVPTAGGGCDLSEQEPREARIAREAIDRFLSGQSQGGVIAWMNEHCTTTRGNPWKANAFRAWLTSPRIAGLIEHDGKYHPGNWTGLCTPEEWEDVKALLLQQRETYGYSGRERVHLLTGKAAECSGCDGPLFSKPDGHTDRRMYYCKNPRCPRRVSRNQRHLDEYVIGRVLRRLNEPAFLEALHADIERPGVGAAIATLERRKSKDQAVLEDLASHPEVDTAVLVRGLASYDREIARLRAQLATSTQHRMLARMAGFTREQWDAEPIDVRSATVQALFRVVVLPSRRGPGFDPAGVLMERKAVAAKAVTLP